MAPPPALPGPQGPGLGWPCLTLRDGLGASLRGAPAFASKPERCRVALGERLDLLGYSQGLHSRETGIGHRAVSEGSGRVWRATTSISSSRNPSTAMRGGGPLCSGHRSAPHPPLHSGHSSGPDSEARSHLRPHGGPAWKPRCPCSAPGRGGEAGGLGPQSTPTLRPGLSA